MTQLQLFRKVKSLAWRRNIAGSLEELEAEIKAYMFEKGRDTMVVAGYSVKLNGENLSLEKLPVSDLKQRTFKFSREKKQDYAFQN